MKEGDIERKQGGEFGRGIKTDPNERRESDTFGEVVGSDDESDGEVLPVPPPQQQQAVVPQHIDPCQVDDGSATANATSVAPPHASVMGVVYGGGSNVGNHGGHDGGDAF